MATPATEPAGARSAAVAGLLAFGVPLGLYLLTATRSVQGGDTAEFALVAALGGVPHPPGYPLHTALARLLHALQPGDPVLRAALLSALCGAGTAAVLQRVLWRLTGSALASLGGALAFALSPIAWRLAGVPEVFTLNTLLCAALLLFCLRLADAPPHRVAREALGTGLLFGLGLANHHTIVLCAPLPLFGLVAQARRAGWRPAARAAAVTAGGVLLGLLPYALLPVYARAPGAWVWGDPGTLDGLVRHVTRDEYGTLQLGLSRSARRPAAHVWHFLGGLPRAFFYVYLVAGLFGAVALARRRRGLALALGASFLLAGVALPAWFNLPDAPTARAVAERFHLLPTLLVAVAVGAGLQAIVARLSRPAGVLLVALPLPLAALLTFGSVDWRADRTVERYLVAAVRDLAPEAVILGQGDLELFGFEYVTRARRVRPDVRYVDVNLLRRPWYHARVRRELPEVELPYDAATTHLAAVIAASAARRPTYLTASLAVLAPRVPVYPEGLLARVATPGAPPPAPRDLEPKASRALQALAPLSPPVDPWSVYAREQAAAPWRSLAAAFAGRGDQAAARECAARARLLAPAGAP